MGYLAPWNLVCFKNGWCAGGLAKSTQGNALKQPGAENQKKAVDFWYFRQSKIPKYLKCFLNTVT